jgi:hypothetical protein
MSEETKFAEWDDEGEGLVPALYDNLETVEPTTKEEALMLAERKIEKALNTHFLAIEKKIEKWDGSTPIDYSIKNKNKLIADSLKTLYEQQGWKVVVKVKKYTSGPYYAKTQKTGHQITLS